MKILIFRLSSLGDVILSTAALNSATNGTAQVDWVVAKEFAPLLRGHPRIGRLWEFDRRSGLAGWIRLCRELSLERYDRVLDLHSSLRTRVAWAVMPVLALGSRRLKFPRWTRLRKQRWRMWGYCLFHSYWPAALRPRPFVERFARAAGGSGLERPELRHLASRAAETGSSGSRSVLLAEPYHCVMPGSKWRGKCWPASRYFDVIRSCPSEHPVILGGAQDPDSVELVRLLTEAGIRHTSGVGRWDLPEVAAVLAGAKRYLGNDTGLAHLAEALGVPALVIYGPSAPELGFGPWRPESCAVGIPNLGCRPCGKDGRRCYRPKQKYLCMTRLDSSQVVAELEKMKGGHS